MSNITTIYDTTLTRLATIFTGRTKIPNAYSLADNNTLFLRDGYGLKVVSSQVEESEFCNYAYSVSFAIVITKEVLRLDSDSNQIDTVSKALLEDLKTLQDNFLAYDQIGINNNIEKIDFNGSSGIEFIVGDKFNFATLEVAINIMVREQL